MFFGTTESYVAFTKVGTRYFGFSLTGRFDARRHESNLERREVERERQYSTAHGEFREQIR